MIDTNLRERREAVIREHLLAENEHRFSDAIATFRHPRYELIANGLTYDGAEAVMRYFRTSRAAVPDQRNEPISLRHADDAVVMEFWVVGTVIDPDDPTRLNDHPFRCRAVSIFEFDDDRITCERVYWDRQTITDQLKGM